MAYLIISSLVFIRVENTVPTPRKLEATDQRQVRVPITTLYWSEYIPRDSIPVCGIDSLVGKPGDRATVPLGREQLKAHFALFSTREIQNNAQVGWKNHCDFAGILTYRTLIAVHCASIEAIARVLQPLREYCSHCASIAAIARVLQPLRIARASQPLRWHCDLLRNNCASSVLYTPLRECLHPRTSS